MSTRCPIILVAALLLAGCVSDGRPKGDLQPFADLTTDEVQQGLRPRRLCRRGGGTPLGTAWR